MIKRTTVPCLWLALLSTSLVHVTAAADCNLQCHLNATCVEGEADFTDYTTTEGDVLAFHQQTSINNEHCACPPEWTGVTCNRKFEGCDYDHECYNGGKCIPGLVDFYGNDQFFCDCSAAVDEEGYNYVGKYCEHQGLERCDEDGLFCVNGGECNDAYPLVGDPCVCKGGYTGPHCEFKTGSVPNCDLQCNAGHCALGIVYPNQVHDLAHMFSSKAYQRCVCLPGFGGPTCEIERVECGGNHCYHGGNCVTKELDGEIDFHCDCSTATAPDFSGAKFAGRFCQYRSDDLCTEVPTSNGVLFCVNGGHCKMDASQVHEGCDCPADVYGPSCEFVHANATTDMNDDDDDAFKDDADDDTGDSSVKEIPVYDEDPDADGNGIADYAECRLLCENEGKCRKGIKDLGIISTALDAAYLNVSSDQNFEHCTCPENFVGIRCEHSLEICEAGKHVCLHGSKCVAYGEETGCDCSTASTTFSSNFAGASCQHEATDMCTVGTVELGQSRSFCVNDGLCKAYVSASENEPGCTCVNDWTGPHCELKASAVAGFKETPVNAVTPTATPAPIRAPVAPPVTEASPPVAALPVTTPLSSSANNGDGQVGFQVVVLIISLLAFVASVSVFVFVFSRRRQARHKEVEHAVENSTNSYPSFEEAYPSAGLSNRQPFRDPDSDAMSVNLGLDEGGYKDQPQVYIGPPIDEDGHELHNVEIL